MKVLHEGEKRNIAANVKRLTGSGAINLTTPQRRILDANQAVVPGFDWAPATWDAANNKLFALFDASAAPLNQLGTYFVQLRGAIDAEIYVAQVTVKVEDFGP